MNVHTSHNDIKVSANQAGSSAPAAHPQAPVNVDRILRNLEEREQVEWDPGENVNPGEKMDPEEAAELDEEKNNQSEHLMDIDDSISQLEAVHLELTRQLNRARAS